MCYEEAMMITLDEYRAIAGLKDTSKDSQIEALIPLVEDDYLSIRNRDWDRAEDGSIVYPDGSKLTAAEMITYRLSTLPGAVGYSSESIGDYSMTLDTHDMLHGYPRHIITKIRRYGRAR